MSSPVPTPFAAALGIVPTVLGGVRRLPARAVQLPIFAVSSALTTLDTARREYDALAERGERLIARLRGTSVDELEDRVEDALSGTRLARPYDAVEDAIEDAAETVTALVRSAPAAARKAPAQARKAASRATTSTGRALDRAADTVEDAAAAAAGSAVDAVDGAQDAGTPDQERKGAPTPKASQPDSTRIDTAATSDVVEAVERVSAAVGGAVLAHDELPLPDYDHLTLGSLRGRMRSLDLPELVQIRTYEKAHADRLPIVTMLDNRIAKLAADPTAPLSGGSPAAPDAAKPAPAAGGSPVTPATGAPVQNPPAQGDPTNPARPH